MAKVVFRLNLEGKTPSSWELPQTSVMANRPNKGKKFINYYLGEDSCYVEDIELKNKDLKPTKVPLFEFNPRSKATELRVDHTNVSLINYLKTHPWFGVKYNEFSAEKEAKDALNEYSKVEEALENIKEADETNIKAISMAVFGLNSFYKTSTQCRAELKATAFKNPEKINDAKSNPNFDTKFIAGLAFVSNIIKINPTHTAIVWSDNDGLILHIAQGENGLDKLTNFLTSETKEAQLLLQEFSNRLDRKNEAKSISLESLKEKDELINSKDAEIEELRRKLQEAESKKEVVIVEVSNNGTEEEVDDNNTSATVEDTKISLEELQEAYIKKTGKELPLAYKNNEIWLAKKLAE